MADELDEIRQRLETLERQFHSGSGLRAMMDLDQASLTVRLDAQDNLLRALSITQSDHTSRLTRLEEGHRGLKEDHHRLEDSIGRVEVGIQAILGLLSNGR